MVDLPKQYEDGFVEFLGAHIDLSKRPLIPRPETEYWSRLAIDEIKQKENVRCLDIFSGSGCIGIALLKNTEDAHCDFGEKENDFLEQIEINAKQNDIKPERFEIIKTDIFSRITEKYDFILANPPYVAEDRINDVGEDVLSYEPRVALFSGKEGMDIIEVFLEEARNHLNDEGIIYLEFDQEQQQRIDDILKGNSYSGWKFLRDQFGSVRFVRIIK